MKFAASILASLAIALQALGGMALGSCLGCELDHESVEVSSHCHGGGCSGDHSHHEPFHCEQGENSEQPCNCSCHDLDSPLIDELGVEFRLPLSKIPSEPVSEEPFIGFSPALGICALNQRGPPPDALSARNQTASRTLWSVYRL